MRTFVSLGDAYWKLKDLAHAREAWADGLKEFPGDAALAARVRGAGAVLLGPNCLGVLDSGRRLELVPNPLPAGSIGLISQSGNLALELQGTDLAEIAAEAVAEARPDARHKQIDLVLSAAGVPEFAADPGRISQLLDCLLSNAVKFTGDGGKVAVRTGVVDGQAVLTVTDTGVGIPADELPHIFDRFWRGQAAAGTSGSGIGLAIAAELARAHGGTLTAASEPGKATTLTLPLPPA